MRHEGKTMIVTGAAGAIGFATCDILCREGAKVMLVDIAADRLEERTAELLDAGHDVLACPADCADGTAWFCRYQCRVARGFPWRGCLGRFG